jgi:hypothetical protein
MSDRRRLPLLATAATVLCALAAVPPAHAATGAAPTFAGRQVPALGAGVTDPRALAVADLDGDGRPDLVAGSANGGTGMVSVLRGTGAGAFAAPLGSPFGLATTGGVGAIAVGDLNGDGRDDVLATIGSGTADDDELVPLAGDGTGALSAGTPVAVAGEQLAGVALADLDDDGDLDALTASTTAVGAEQLGVVEQTASGLAVAGATGATGTMLARAVAAGDLTGDGTPDALVASANGGTGSAWVASGGGLALTAGTPVGVGAGPVAAALGDVDGDGDLDGLVLDGTANLLTILRNDGAGSLTASGVLVDGLAAGTGLATGDLNGDGHLDVVVADGAAGAVGVLAGDGDGGFGSPVWAATGAGPRSPVVADLTGDGRPDVATADAAADGLSLLRNTGAAAPLGALAGAFGAQEVGTTGAAHAITITNAGAARLAVTSVATAGTDSDDFLVTGDTCTGASLRSDGADACTVRVRFAPSAAGARAAVLRVRHGAGATYDVPLAGTATAPEDDDAAAATTTPATTAAAPAQTTATTPVKPATPPATPKPATPKKTTKLILTLSHAKLTARPGAKVSVGFALGRAAKLVLRVKHGGRTVDLLRASAHEGRGTVVWDGKLGRRAAPKGAYRLDVHAVAADGRAARASVTLIIKA